jgi:hypothetical protein
VASCGLFSDSHETFGILLAKKRVDALAILRAPFQFLIVEQFVELFRRRL